MKRVIVMILIFVMVIGAVGCSNNDGNVDNKVTDGVDDGKGENDDGEKNTDLGGNNSQNTDSVLEDYRRYIETDIELPAVVADGSDILLSCLTAGKDGELVIYTAERMKAKEDGENYEGIKNFKEFHYTGDGWSEASPKWLNAAVSNVSLSKVTILNNSNGGKYALYTDNDEISHLVTEDTDGNGKEIDIPELKRKKNGAVMIPIEAAALENGNIAITYQNNECAIYSGTDGSRLLTLECGYSGSLAAYGNYVVVNDISNTNTIIYDTKDGSIAATIPGGGKLDEGTYYYADSNGNLYLLNRNVVAEKAAADLCWTLTLDGSRTSLMDYSIFPSSILPSEDNSYYVRFSGKVTSGDGSVQYIRHYTYKPGSEDDGQGTVEVNDSKKLSIFSLRDNETIRTAISKYQIKNPDIEIDYRVAQTEEGAVTDEDLIRAFNTELFAGGGADVIILDGLPMEDYVRKGVLADLKGLLGETFSNASIHQGVVNAYTIDGKQYLMPLRIGFPSIWGKQEVIERAGTLDELTELAVSGDGKPLFGECITSSALLRTLYQIYRINLTTAGELDRQKLEDFALKIKQICDADGISDDVDYRIGYKRDFNDEPGHITTKTIYYEETTMAIDNVLGLWKAMIPIGVIDNYGYDYKSISNSFMPCCIMGINSSTKNIKAATQFLEEALSYEVQINDMQDGFSVNITALDGWKKRKELNSLGVGSSIDKMLVINWPSEDRINTIIEAVKKLDTPIKSDETMMGILTEKISEYCNEKISIDEYVDYVANKAGLYLAE